MALIFMRASAVTISIPGVAEDIIFVIDSGAMLCRLLLQRYAAGEDGAFAFDEWRGLRRYSLFLR